MPRALVAATLSVVVVAPALVGCSPSREDYCAEVRQDRGRLASLSQQTTRPGDEGSRALRRTVGLLRDLRDAAPDDIHEEWVRPTEAFEGLQRAIVDSGADPGDFRGGRRPAGVTAGQQRAVRQAAAELSATPVQQAGQSIEQHARDVCKVELGSGLGS